MDADGSAAGGVDGDAVPTDFSGPRPSAVPSLTVADVGLAEGGEGGDAGGGGGVDDDDGDGGGDDGDGDGNDSATKADKTDASKRKRNRSKSKAKSKVKAKKDKTGKSGGGGASGGGSGGGAASSDLPITIHGCMPLRGDFDVEWDNDAELLLADMEFSEVGAYDDVVLCGGGSGSGCGWRGIGAGVAGKPLDVL